MVHVVTLVFLLSTGFSGYSSVAIDELLEEIHTLKRRIDVLTSDVQRFKVQFNEKSVCQRCLGTNGTDFRGRREAESISFVATKTNPQQVSPGSIIKYESVFSNVGNMYNSHTGIATIPKTGTYLFSFSIENWQPVQIIARLLVDGSATVSAIIDHGQYALQSGNTAALFLTLGQSVWVESVSSGRINSGDFTSFTGVFLN